MHQKSVCKIKVTDEIPSNLTDYSTRGPWLMCFLQSEKKITNSEFFVLTNWLLLREFLSTHAIETLTSLKLKHTVLALKILAI